MIGVKLTPVKPFIRPFIEVITPFITGRGPYLVGTIDLKWPLVLYTLIIDPKQYFFMDGMEHLSLVHVRIPIQFPPL